MFACRVIAVIGIVHTVSRAGEEYNTLLNRVEGGCVVWTVQASAELTVEAEVKVEAEVGNCALDGTVRDVTDVTDPRDVGKEALRRC